MGGERGLLSVAGFVETFSTNLSLYLDQSGEKLLRLSKNQKILPEYEGPVSAVKKLKKWKTKAMETEAASWETCKINES